MPVQVDVTVQSTPTTTSVETESTKTTSNVTLTGPQGPPGTGLIDGGTYWASNRNFLPNESGIENLGAGSQTWGNLFSNTGYFNDLTVSGALNVSGDFNIGDSQTDTITTQGDLYVQDDAFFGDEVVITGALSAGNVLPRTHDTYNLGSPTYRWANIYAKSGHFADNTIVIGTGGAQISVTGDQIRLKGNTATAGTFFDGNLFLDGGTLTTQKPEGAQFKILNTNATNGYEFALDDDGNLGVSGSLGGDVNFSNNVSVNTNGYLGVPVGTTAQRPGTPANGMIRLNTTNSQFEGYHSSNWQGLGGVIDVDRDTYVSTEKTSDDDTLYFYTAGTERARIESNGNIKLNSNTFINNDLTVSGNLSVSGNFTLGDTTTDSITSRGDLRVLDDSYFADSVTVTGSASFKSGVDIEKDLTVSGNVTASDPTQNGHLSTKSYVDSADSNLQTQITNNDSDITALQTATGSLQTQVSNNDSDISALNTATGSLQSQVTSNDTDISNINTNINTLLGDTVRTTGVQTVSGEKTFAHKATFLNDIAVSGNFTLGDTTADRITSKGDLYVDDAAFVKTSLTVSGVTTFEGNVIGQAPTQNSHFTTKSYVDTEVAAFQAQITSNDNELASLHTATGSLQSQVTSNDTDISTLNTATGSLQSQVTSNDTDITNLKTATGSLQTQVNSNDSEIAALNTATGSLQSQVTSNDTDINDLSGKAILNTGDQTISGVKTFAENVKVLGDLSVSGSFTLGDETTDQIITRGDLIVEDTVNVTGDATFNGSVGIGTDSPTAELHITDAATPQMKIQDTTNNVVATVYADNSKSFFGTDSSHPVHIGSNGASHISVENDGNVGVSGNFSVASSQSFHFYATNAGETRAKKIALGQAVPNNNALNIQPHDNNTNPLLVKTFGGATSIVVDASNQVGIGTSSPDKKLHVAGDFKADGEFHMAGDIRDNRGNLVISQSAANISQNRTLTFGNSNYSNFNFTTNITYNAAPVNPTDLTNKAYVDGLNANALLVTGGAQTVTGDKTFVNNLTVLGDLGVSGDFTLGDANTDSITTKGDLFVQDDAVFSDTITVTGLANFQGSVGVGTSSPTTDFHVSTDEEIVAVFQSSDNGSHIQVRDDDSSVYLGAEGSVGYLGLNNTLSANNLNIKGGSIGIGTTSPSYKIHIKDGYLYTDKNFGAAERTEVGRLLANATSNGGGLSIQANISATASERYSLLQSMDSDGGNRDLSLNNFGGNVGIGTLAPSVKLDINSTDAIKVPVGTTAQRPTAADGMIRFNSTTSKYEGYRDSAWKELGGGVIDLDEDTYVSTEKSSDDDTLFFYTAGGERAKVTSAGHIFTSGNLTVSGTLSSTQITNLNTATGSLQTQVTSNDTDISALQTATGSLQTQVTANDTDISALNTATGSLQTQVTANDTDISALNTATGSLQTQVTANDTDISALNTATGVLDSTTVKLTGNQTIAGVKTFSNNAIFNGDLTVNGTTMTVDTSNVLVEDPVLLLAKNQTGSASLDAGFIAERGDDTNVGFIWDESDDHFAVINTTEDATDADITIASYADFKAGQITAGTLKTLSNSYGATTDYELTDNGVIRASAGLWVAGNGINFGTHTSNASAGGYNSDVTTRLVINNSGSVGIGTTTPSNTLDINGGLEVNGESYIRSTSNVGLRIQTTDQGITNSDGLRLGLNGTHAFLWVYENKPLALATNGAERATILGNGNFGIGTTSPDSNLDIEGTGSPELRVTDTTNTVGAYIQSNDTKTIFGSRTNHPVQIEQNAGAALYIDTSKNVGIGTTSPARKLHVSGGSESRSDVQVTYDSLGTSGNDGAQFGIQSAGAYIWNYENSSIYFGTNNGERVRILNNGNVGVGTSSPESLLHLRGSIPTLILHDTNSSVSGDDYGKIQWHTQDSSMPGTNDIGAEIKATDDSTYGDRAAILFSTAHNATSLTERMRIASNGNVGIGDATPDFKLDVAGTGRFAGDNSATPLTVNGGTATLASIQLNGGTNAVDNSSIQAKYSLVLASNSTNGISNRSIMFKNGTTEQMRIAADGNVGIGSTAPSFKLQVNGTVRINSGDSFLDDGQSIRWGGTAAKIDGSSGGDYLRFYTDGAERMRVISGGNVGIGTPTPTVGNLQLRNSSVSILALTRTNGSTTSDMGIIRFGNTDIDSNLANIIATHDGATDSAKLVFQTQATGAATADRMTIKSDGNVGIGTSAPALPLQISDTGFGQLRLTRDATDDRHWDFLVATSGYMAIKPNNSSGTDKEYITIRDGSNNEKIRLATADDSFFVGGSVGIGTSTPTQLLEVNGSIAITNGIKLSRTSQYENLISCEDSGGNQTLKILGNRAASNGSTGTDIRIGGEQDRTTGNAFEVVQGSSTYFQIASSGAATFFSNSITAGGGTFTGNVSFGDNKKLLLGAGGDLQIYHDGSNSYVHDFNGTGDLILKGDNVRIKTGTSNDDVLRSYSDGAIELYYDDSKKFATTSYGVDITGRLVTTGHIDAPDNSRIRLGDGDDLQLYHDGSNSWITNSGTGILIIGDNNGDVRIRGKSGEESIVANDDGAVELYYDNSKKLETTSGGVTVTGLLTATTKSFTIDHPTKPGKKLRHGSLEGPENGVYIRGKSNNNSIELPEYWTKLVDEDSITVQLTAIGKPQQLYVERIDNNIVYVQSEENRKNISQLNYYYLIHAERIDVDKLQVEIEE